MTAAPFASIVVPAHQAARLLPGTLAALDAGRRAAGGVWELIVVDDGSNDGTAEVARRFADRVIRLEPPSGGPSRARNSGAAAAGGEWLLFVDADVRVHPDTLARFAASVHRHPGAAAIFGTYDAMPEAPGFVSQYRNLLHRYFHLVGAGAAETFWAGLGGVRTGDFRRAGGFDAVRHPRQLEDVELGYRLRDAGLNIVLDPSIEGTHLKAWSFSLMAITDFRDRGLTWMRIVLERRRTRAASLNLGWGERIRVLLAGAGMLAAAAALVWWSPVPGFIGAGLYAALVASNLQVYRWFARQKGWLFAAAVVPLHLWYYASNALAVGVGLLAHAGRRLASAPRPSHA